MNRTSICTTVLRFTVLLSCWLQAHHNVFAANVTVMDTDPSIVYSPVESWSPSSNLCSTCINPNDSMSYHEGINSAPSLGSTVVSTSSTGVPTASPLPNPPTPTSSPNLVVTSEGGDSPPTVSSSSPSPLPPPPAPTSSSILTSEAGPPPTVSSSPSPSPTDGGHGGSHHGSSDNDRRALVRQLPNGSDSADIPVTLSYNFTGTAIYLFSIQPPTEAPVGGSPTYTNLSFTLDNHPAGYFYPTETSAEFQPNTNVLSLVGLSNQPHQLVVTVGNDSVFLFDYLIYTNSSNGTSTPSTSQSTPKHDKKNNVATFAGAVGGSVGVLSLFSLGIAISIIRRRILAARRDRLDNEANLNSDTASMSGPMPFIPRYFPDTIIPQEPPTYIDALSTTNHNNTPLLASLASLASSIYTSRQRSYADIPPNSPPPPLEELPPPPFPIALSTPVHSLPPDVTPSIPDVNQTDQGSDSSTVTTPLAHEDTPLLQSSDSDTTRPRSRASSTDSTRSLELPEDSETNSHQEADAS